MSLVKKRYYFYDFFKTQDGIPSFYGSVKSKSAQTVLYDSFSNSTENQPVCKINHIPDYLQIEYNNEDNLNIKSLNRDLGYAIDLNNVSDINSYVNQQFKKGRTIRRYVSKLESSFNITYKRYYGDIPKDVYDELLQCLFKMVQKRFVQLNDINEQINDDIRWKTTLEETYALIKEKRASLFVIYEDDKPIVISIGHHWGSVFYYVMCSFDIDYAKFALGHVNFYKQLEWCINEGYEIFDCGLGEYHYKKRWSNKTYILLQQVICNKGNILDELIANVEITLTLIKKNLALEKLKLYLKSIKKTFIKTNYKALECNISYINEQDSNLQDYTKINIKNDDYAF
ncbi:GNAT family N-acetyltransferase [Winogradskyella sp.]|nr:GNAT family N-acetyltransferase [Winogradskyella sp.]